MTPSQMASQLQILLDLYPENDDRFVEAVLRMKADIESPQILDETGLWAAPARELVALADEKPRKPESIAEARRCARKFIEIVNQTLRVFPTAAQTVSQIKVLLDIYAQDPSALVAALRQYHDSFQSPLLSEDSTILGVMGKQISQELQSSPMTPEAMNRIRVLAEDFVNKYGQLAAEEGHSFPAIKLASVQSALTIVATIVALLIGQGVGILKAIGESTPRTVAASGIWDWPSLIAPWIAKEDCPNSLSGGLFHLHLAQTFVVVLLTLLLYTRFADTQSIPPQLEALSPEARRVATGTWRQFATGWRVVWWSWVLYYVWKTIQSRLGGPERPLYLVIDDILQLPSTLAFLWCFLALDRKSIPTERNPNRTQEFYLAVGAVAGVGVLACGLSVAGRYVEQLSEIGPFSLSIFAGLAIAFFVGKLDSHWIGLPRYMLAPLYCYALLQVNYAVFGDGARVAAEPYSYALALVLKIALFFVVRDLFKDGHFKRYVMGIVNYELTTERYSPRYAAWDI